MTIHSRAFRSTLTLASMACLFGTVTISSALAQDNVRVQLLKEFRPIGGGGNNLQHPEFDPVPGSPQVNIAPLNFVPGSNNVPTPAPNPRVISNVIAGGSGANGQNSDSEDPRASAWLYVFGQFLDHDIDLETNSPTTEPINIVVPDNDPVFKPGTTILMNRDVRDPNTNTIVNTTAGYLDLSQLYGSNTAVAASLRNADGTLITSGNGKYLPVSNGSFITGDPRVMENPELSAVTTLFMREHNFWVAKLKASHSNWSGDQLYNMAKAITTAEYQNIVYNEYLPLAVGNVLGPYTGYNSNISAQVTQEFSTSAFRMGHSEISDEQTGLDNLGKVTYTQPLSEAFFNTAEQTEANGIDDLLRGVSADNSQATDVYTVATLRNLLFAPLAGGDVDEMDLIAIDIQRQHDVGVGTLNQTRRALGLRPYRSFDQLTSDRTLQRNLKTVYGDVDNVDLFIGGLAEAHSPGAELGPTFQMIIGRQFYALRAGDRFFWMNQGFDQGTAFTIARTTLSDIIKRDTDTTTLQASVFLVPTTVASNPPRRHWHINRPIDMHGRPNPRTRIFEH